MISHADNESHGAVSGLLGDQTGQSPQTRKIARDKGNIAMQQHAGEPL